MSSSNTKPYNSPRSSACPLHERLVPAYNVGDVIFYRCPKCQHVFAIAEVELDQQEKGGANLVSLN